MSQARRARREARRRQQSEAAAAAAPPAARSARIGEAAVVAAIACTYALLKTHAMHAAITDENIYFYDAVLVARGRLPYRDFFFAHPPLHLYVPAILFRLLGFSITLGKAVPAGASVISGLCLWALARRRMGRVAAVATLLLFWFALEELKSSTDMTGVNLATAWMCAGLWAALSGRFFLGGALLGCAAGTGLYVAAGLCVLGLFSFFAQDRRPAPWLRLAAGFLLTFGILNLAFLIAAGDSFMAGVYRYHLLKPEKDQPTKPWQVVYEHAIQLWTAALAAGMLAARRFRPTSWTRTPEGVAALAVATALAFFAEFAMLAEFYDFYFVVAIPALALAGGWFLGEVLVGAYQAMNREDWRRAAAWGACLLLLAGFWPLKDFAQRRGYPDEMEHAGARNTYAWTDPPVLPQLGFVVKALFWKDFRVRGESEWGVRHYLWNKKRPFATAPEIADYVRAHSAPGETIAGASMVAPLIALLSGRDIAADEVDTNAKRFKTGLLTERTFFERICGTPVRFLIAAPHSYFEPGRVAGLRTVQTQFARDQTFIDRSIFYQQDFPVVLYRRTTPTGPPFCRWED
jgi:hypothetical protein